MNRLLELVLASLGVKVVSASTGEVLIQEINKPRNSSFAVQSSINSHRDLVLIFEEHMGGSYTVITAVEDVEDQLPLPYGGTVISMPRELWEQFKYQLDGLTVIESLVHPNLPVIDETKRSFCED